MEWRKPWRSCWSWWWWQQQCATSFIAHQIRQSKRFLPCVAPPPREITFFLPLTLPFFQKVSAKKSFEKQRERHHHQLEHTQPQYFCRQQKKLTTKLYTHIPLPLLLFGKSRVVLRKEISANKPSGSSRSEEREFKIDTFYLLRTWHTAQATTRHRLKKARQRCILICSAE